MRLSDIRGERSLDIIADVMELADAMSDDENFEELLDAMRKGPKEDDVWRLLCQKVPPLLRERKYRKPVISILAAASDVTYDEYAQNGEVLKDIFELLTSDVEALAFFAPTEATKE